ncbi:hypothetical protein [Bradyrhizobium elkanii]
MLAILIAALFRPRSSRYSNPNLWRKAAELRAALMLVAMRSLTS